MLIAIAIIFALFLLCFLAIVVEEMFLGGRRRRHAEKTLKERRDENNAGC